MIFFFNLSWLTLSFKVFVCLDYSVKARLIFLLPFTPLGVAINTGTCFTGFCFLHIKGHKQPFGADLCFLLILQEPHNNIHLHNRAESFRNGLRRKLPGAVAWGLGEDPYSKSVTPSQVLLGAADVLCPNLTLLF